MVTVATSLPLFSRPGPLRDLVTDRGWQTLYFNESSQPAPSEVTYFICGTAKLDAAFFAAMPALKLVAMFGVGVDHIDLTAATHHGVLVTNAPGGNTRCVAELALSLMLDLAHRVTEMHTNLATGVWRPRMGSELAGKTLGIVGLGHIGQLVATMGKALGMTVIAANRSPKQEVTRRLGIAQLSLTDVLKQSDFLSLHIPGGPESWHFGPAEFAAMKKNAFFINTARGDLVNLDALVDALESKHLAGAGLDVFPAEPMDPGHRIFSLPQAVFTPHAGAMSLESWHRVTSSCLEEIERILARKRSPHACNPKVYESPAWAGFTTPFSPKAL